MKQGGAVDAPERYFENYFERVLTVWQFMLQGKFRQTDVARKADENLRPESSLFGIWQKSYLLP